MSLVKKSMIFIVALSLMVGLVPVAFFCQYHPLSHLYSNRPNCTLLSYHTQNPIKRSMQIKDIMGNEIGAFYLSTGSKMI